MKYKKRCHWVTDDPIYIDYHDKEWGVPCYDDQRLFEMLILEGAQAGLSWLTILKKREGYRKAFARFEAKKIARFSEKKIETLLENPAIVRNRLKVNAAVNNAHAYLAVQKEYGSFADYIWQFIGGQPRINHWKKFEDIPVITAESENMSRDLKKRGFKFVGSTICYAYMQSIGMVNDHTTDCFLYK
ncbi:DNA-3-methyladenine glycosylase [hydrothermal vent metagenome]|uniref:DNA-3-methyladenine glycosylase n=1 Tax=hydrothermal vent metagenome TaxID=652676 RepID=A0A3B1BEC2_9ZZZZ